MPFATINGAEIRYEVLGESGPWITLSPGGRRELDSVAPVARLMAQAGYRVLIHDRRNCGQSDLVIDASTAEDEIWVEDLHALLTRLGAAPVIAGGASSGSRLATLLALRHPKSVRALLLWRVTGGPFAVDFLSEAYYGQYIAAARKGGMQAVAATEHFAERLAARPANRERLLAMDPAAFVDGMAHWKSLMARWRTTPMLGATEADLRSIAVPALVIPGRDRIHGPETGEAVHKLIAGSEFHVLMPGLLDVDFEPAENWSAKDPELATLFADFLKRRLP